MVGQQNADIADTLHLKDVAIWGAHWRHLANTTEPFVCGGDAALRQISLTMKRQGKPNFYSYT